MKQNETGRSMVEMLGVLAIIGVLSIGGIAGYTMAMNRYRANEIIDVASKLSVVAQTNGANGVSGFTNLKLSTIDMPEEKVHGAAFNVCKNGKVSVTAESIGIQNALASIIGKTYTTGIDVIAGSGASDTASDCKKLPYSMKPEMN